MLSTGYVQLAPQAAAICSSFPQLFPDQINEEEDEDVGGIRDRKHKHDKDRDRDIDRDRDRGRDRDRDRDRDEVGGVQGPPGSPYPPRHDIRR